MNPGPKKRQGIFGQSNTSNNSGCHGLSDHSNLIHNHQKNLSTSSGHRLSDHSNTVVISHNSPYTTNRNKLSDKTKSNNSSSIHPSNSIKEGSMNKNSNKNISLASDQGPKRGCLYGSNSIHNCSIIEANKAADKKTIVPLSEDPNGKLQFGHH